MSQAAVENSAEPILLRQQSDGVHTLTLNRPRQYNALSREMLSSLQSALDEIARDPEVRVVVLAGSGPAFCAGHDLKEMRGRPDKAFQKELFEQCSRMMLSLTRLPQPVIARVHGTATAAGCQLVATCDLAVASRGARFATSGINLGLFCSTPAVALSRNVARKHALEMLVTGDFIDADAALARGLVNRVVTEAEIDRAVAELAATICAKPAVAVRAGKEMFYKQLELGLADAYAYASEVMACNMMTEEACEGIDAFLQKRAPAWR